MSDRPQDGEATAHLLSARIALLTQPVHPKLGGWKVFPTHKGAVLAVRRCGLGDAGFLPQSLDHGGLVLRRIGLDAIRASGAPARGLTIGEISWPLPDDAEAPVVVPPLDAPLVLQAALPQAYSVRIHARIPASRLDSSGFAKKMQPSLEKIHKVLSCKWWRGLAPTSHRGEQQSSFNLHVSTKEEEPLTPYEFEDRVMPPSSRLRSLRSKTGYSFDSRIQAQIG